MSTDLRSTIILEIHASARKHGVPVADIAHAVVHAMSIDDRDNGTRLYLGPARDANLLEVATVIHGSAELAIHAMKMRSKFSRLLPGG